MEKHVTCPECNSDALYKYGKNPEGKQKYQCLLCGRQFVVNPSKKRFNKRPTCPKCGVSMHLYKRENHTLRFRCALYPRCKTYLKFNTEE